MNYLKLFKFASNTQIGTFVYSVEVDGNAVELQASTNFTFDYQFTTTGEHLAKIYLKRTWQGDIFSINFNSNTNIIASRIPKQITTMQSTFYHCTNLTDIIIDYDSMLPDTGMQTYEGCTSLKNINLCNATHITKIPTNCFNGTGLEEVTIPDDVSLLQSGSFCNCKSLKYLYISLNSKLKTIEQNSFNGCTDLEYVHLPKTISTFGNNAFFNCTKAEGTIDFMNDATIGDGSFRNCAKLNFKHINNISYFGTYSLSATSIKTAEIKENAFMSIRVFDDCKDLETFIFDGDITMTNWNYPIATNCTKLTSIIFKKPISKLPSAAFQGASALASIDLSNVASFSEGGIGNQMHNMETCIFSPTLIRIPARMFAYWDNTNLTVTIPASVTEIGDEAFQNCRGTFYILATTPPTLTNISRINNNMTIYVPVESIDTYKAAEYWSDVANRIFAIPE